MDSVTNYFCVCSLFKWEHCSLLVLVVKSIFFHFHILYCGGIVSKCSISIFCELVSSVNSQTHSSLLDQKLEVEPSNLCINRPSGPGDSDVS